MLLVHHADHLIPPNLQRGAGGDGRGRGQSQSRHRRQRLFAHKVAAVRSVMVASLPAFDSTVILARPLLKIEDRIRRLALRKESFLGLQLNDFAPQACAGQKGGCIEHGLVKAQPS